MDAHAHHADLGHERVTPLSVYLGIFGALMALTAITVGVAWVNLGSLNILVALGVRWSRRAWSSCTSCISSTAPS